MEGLRTPQEPLLVAEAELSGLLPRLLSAVVLPDLVLTTRTRARVALAAASAAPVVALAAPVVALVDPQVDSEAVEAASAARVRPRQTWTLTPVSRTSLLPQHLCPFPADLRRVPVLGLRSGLADRTDLAGPADLSAGLRGRPDLAARPASAGPPPSRPPPPAASTSITRTCALTASAA